MILYNLLQKRLIYHSKKKKYLILYILYFILFINIDKMILVTIFILKITL